MGGRAQGKGRGQGKELGAGLEQEGAERNEQPTEVTGGSKARERTRGKGAKGGERGGNRKEFCRIIYTAKWQPSINRPQCR